MNQPALLFSIHVWEVDADHDSLLAVALPEWDIIAVAAAPVDDSVSPRARYEHWIETAASSIMAAQPDGPVHLLGWSLGGRLGYVVATRLEQLGRTVVFFGVIDAASEWPSLRPSSLPWLARMLRAERTAGVRWKLIRHGPLSRILWRSKWALSVVVPRRRRAQLLKERPNGEIARYLNPSIVANMRVAASIVLVESTIPVTVYATAASVAYYEKPDLWWSTIVGEHCRVMPISGNHVSLFDEEHRETLLGAIKATLPAVDPLGG